MLSHLKTSVDMLSQLEKLSLNIKSAKTSSVRMQPKERFSKINRHEKTCPTQTLPHPVCWDSEITRHRTGSYYK